MKEVVVDGETYNVVETLDDVFAENKGKEIQFIEEYQDSYYIRFEPEHYYDETIYKVNKISKKAECKHLIDYFFEVAGNGKRINPETLKRAG